MSDERKGWVSQCIKEETRGRVTRESATVLTANPIDKSVDRTSLPILLSLFFPSLDLLFSSLFNPTFLSILGSWLREWRGRIEGKCHTKSMTARETTGRRNMSSMRIMHESRRRKEEHPFLFNSPLLDWFQLNLSQSNLNNKQLPRDWKSDWKRPRNTRQ